MQPREWRRVASFSLLPLVSSLLGGVEEEDKNDNTDENNQCFLSFPLICLFITLAYVLPLGF